MLSFFFFQCRFCDFYEFFFQFAFFFLLAKLRLLCVDFYDLMSRKTISRVIFYLSPPLSLCPAHKVNFREKPEREAKRKAESKLQFKVFSNEQSEPFFPPYHCQISPLRDVLHRVFLRLSSVEWEVIYRAAECTFSHLTIFSSNL